VKEVYFVRHAKSSWEDFRLPDHDRTLNKRGHRDAPIMAQYLAQMERTADCLISSSAIRALTTAKYFAEEWKMKENDIQIISNLYHSNPDTMLENLAQCEDSHNSVALFAHNPGMTMMANHFSPGDIDNIPTCGVFFVRFKIDAWMDLLDDPEYNWMNLWTPKTLN